MSRGTPKTLPEAIANGLDSSMARPDAEAKALAVQPHVRDFLAQKFTQAMLAAKGKGEMRRIDELWKKIIGQSL